MPKDELVYERAPGFPPGVNLSAFLYEEPRPYYLIGKQTMSMSTSYSENELFEVNLYTVDKRLHLEIKMYGDGRWGIREMIGGVDARTIPLPPKPVTPIPDEDVLAHG